MPAKPLTKPLKKPLTKPRKQKVLTNPKLPAREPSVYSRFKPFNPKNVIDVPTRYTTEIVMMIAEDKKGKPRPIKIMNNLDAKNPNLKELNQFLRSDTVKELIKKQKKVLGEYECGDFARDLHNLAEKEGIRCGFVIIYYNHGIGHAMNAFETRDQGIIYIDFAMLGRYDTDRLVGKETERKGKNFYEIKGRRHFETDSGRLRNISEISVTW